MVAPPGEQTASFMAAGCSPVSSCSFAVPSIIWLTILYASARGMPCLTAASARASMPMATNAGEQPPTVPPTNSRRLSSSTTRPSLPSRSSTSARISAPIVEARSTAMTPSLTETGVLGTQERCAAPGRSSSHLAQSQPQATESTALPESSSASGPTTSAIRCGFTATISRSDAATTSAAPEQAVMPRASQRSRSASKCPAQALIRPASTPAAIQPSAMALAMLPKPMKPILIAAPSTMPFAASMPEHARTDASNHAYAKQRT